MVFLGRIRPFFSALLLVALLLGCGDDQKLAKEIANIPIDLKVSRFDMEFNAIAPKDLPGLKKKYPFFFPVQYPDSIWEAKLKDTLQIELRTAVSNSFPTFDEEREALEQLFQHIAYYFPKYQVPRIFTVTNDVEYQHKIILTDTILLVGLDNYLGPDHKFYQGFSNYVSDMLDKQFLVSDVASEFVKTVVPRPNNRDFMAWMIYYGKGLYLKDLIMPFETDAQKIGYSKEQLVWAQEQEEPIWRNFVENEYLYSTDNKLGPRFLDPAPFSKFGLELDNESPGRIGRYVGWQIVRSFMTKNDVSVEQMLKLPEDVIFKKSNYKPNR